MTTLRTGFCNVCRDHLGNVGRQNPDGLYVVPRAGGSPSFQWATVCTSAELRSYEQAKELTISLLEQWLVKYKFRTWSVHRSNPEKKGVGATEDEKKTRAREIAEKLSDTSIWHSHGRAIDIHALQTELRLEIDDYSDNIALRTLVRKYSDLLTGYIGRMGFPMFFHSRKQF